VLLFSFLLFLFCMSVLYQACRQKSSPIKSLSETFSD
jgi:hypothetical protein